MIDPSALSGDHVKFGAHVRLVDEETEKEATYQIVGVHEADIKGGRLSVSSPLAKALIGKKVGDTRLRAGPGRRPVLRDPRHQVRLTCCRFADVAAAADTDRRPRAAYAGTAQPRRVPRDRRRGGAEAGQSAGRPVPSRNVARRTGWRC